MIEFLFTTTNRTFSRLGRWATGNDCSHFAISLDHGIVFHSNLSGAHIEPYSVFLEKNIVMHRVRFKEILTLQQEELIYRRLISMDYGKGYDFGALFFLGFNLIAEKLFGFPLAKNNLWNSQDFLICTEVLNSLSGLELGDFTFPEIRKINMQKPHDLFLVLSRLPQLESV